MRDSKRILIITYKYLPEIAPRVFRWSSLVDYWVKQGHEVDVICASLPGQPNYENIASSKIYRVMPWFKKTKYKSTNQSNSLSENISEKKRDIASLDIERLAISNKSIEIKPSLIRKILNKLIFILHKIIQMVIRTFRAVKRSGQRIFRYLKKLQRNYLWPDYGMYWIIPAINKAIELNKINSYDAIITVSWPVSPHVVGWFIKKYLFKDINWIVDIGDPFSFNTMTPINDFKKFSKLNSSFEKSMLLYANYISVTTEETKEEYIKFFPEVEGKIFVMPPMIPTKNLNYCEEDKAKFISKNRKRIIFTGSLRSKNRRPDTILFLFNQLLLKKNIKEEYELHFYGDAKQCISSFHPYNHLMNNNIFLHGIVSKNIIDRELDTADFLLNIGNVTEYQLPSKVVEYLSANKPIINITPNINDSSWKILSKSSSILNLTIENIEEITHEVLASFEKFLTDEHIKLSEYELQKIVNPYLVDTISDKYLKLINNKEIHNDNL